VGAALGDVPLTPAQRAEVEKLAADAETRQAAIRTARADLALALAADMEAGRIDRAALAPKIDALVAAAQAAQPPDRAAFERLHAILDGDQRTAFANALEARVHERMGEVRDHHPLRQWAKDLGLTDDQRAQLKGVMASRFEAARKQPDGEHREGRRGAKMIAAFKQDRFVMDEVAPARDLAPGMRAKAEERITLAEQVLPVLTPPQRTLAAQKLRALAQGLEGGGPDILP
jgi:Spy/CpxP family protein refolding chaperone